MSTALPGRLRHVYWIGGGSGAGKSVIARRLTARHGLRLYPTDDVMPDHASRSTPGDSPLLSAFAVMDMDERWVNRASPGSAWSRRLAAAHARVPPGRPDVHRTPLPGSGAS